MGEDRQSFRVNEQMIRSSSSFFDKALAGEWKEALNRTVEMPSDDPDVFAVYMHWLYCGTIPILYHKERHSIKGDEFFSSAEHYALVKAYILGDKILDPRFQNAIIDAIAEKVNKVNTIALVHMLSDMCTKTPEIWIRYATFSLPFMCAMATRHGYCFVRTR